MEGEARAARLLRYVRAGLLLLAALSILSLSFELAFLRHWGGSRTIVWLGIAVLSIALALLVIRPTRLRVRTAQGLALTACLVALVGLGFHTVENLEAGPLDRDYADRWEDMSQFDRLFAATTGGVGPAPTLAPGALAQIGLLILIASVGHPALQAGVRPLADDPRSQAEGYA